MTLSEEIIVKYFRRGSLYKVAVHSDSVESLIGILEFLHCSFTATCPVLQCLLYILSQPFLFMGFVLATTYERSLHPPSPSLKLP